jgi:hypothetical protein
MITITDDNCVVTFGKVDLSMWSDEVADNINKWLH